MSAECYFRKSQELISRIQVSQTEAISRAAQIMADSIHRGRSVFLFGSGHSVIPVLDVFPRYGSYVGFRPLMDPRLMWFNVTGPGGAPELLWLERQEGYIASFLQEYPVGEGDAMIVYSHGGLNAAPVEAALYARAKLCRVICVTSLDNHRHSAAVHSSGKKLADLGDVVIDNCVPLEDALVDVGQLEKVAAGSTLAAVTISMALVAETASVLKQKGFRLATFVSPNTEGIEAGHNSSVFEAYRRHCRKTMA